VNQPIVDLHLAPRDADGRVRFRADFSLVQPQKADKARRRLIVELPNRGNKLTGRFNRATGPGNTVGDGFLQRHGWSIASIGWQWDVLRNGANLGLDAPPVLEDGMPVTGLNNVEIRPDAFTRTWLLSDRGHEPYPVHRLDDAEALLTVRDYEDGEDTVIPRSQWRFGRETDNGQVTPSRQHIYLETGFQSGKFYYVTYRAEGARVVGVGLLAFRDIAAFLRRPSDRNPAAAGFDWIYGFGISQTGRALRHFLYHGLNVDEDGNQVYDGVLPHVAGGRRGQNNHRFAQPSNQSNPTFGQLFPFADEITTDPYSERQDGLLKRQREMGGMPKIIYTNSSAEYWRGDGALAHIDPSGEQDLEDAPEARTYHFSSTQHGAGSLTARGGGDGGGGEEGGARMQNSANLVDYTPLLRAALMNLDKWVSEGVEPPPSKHPRLADGTLVPPTQALAVIDRIPGLNTPDPERLWRLRTVDLGPDAARGIPRYPVIEGQEYPHPVAALDSDGNELGGIRLPDLTVPVATNLGWNLRHPEVGSPEQILPMIGSSYFFPRTRAEREQTGDPRPSIEERYSSKEQYLDRVREEARELAAQRYILEGDIDILIENAAARYDAAVGART
jgi:hypothetical protein